MTELIGICATLFVLLSFTQSKPIRIRLINSIGCILFVIYGLQISSISVWLLNGCCILIHIYKSFREYKHN